MKYFKLIAKWGSFLAVWVLIFGSLALLYYFHDLPNISDLKSQESKQVIQIDYSNQQRITSFGEIASGETDYYEIPQNLINAVVATEDRRFFKHHGIDIFGIARAFYVNQKAGRVVQGGSTITQQLAKLIFLTSDRNFKRKIQEVLLAFQLERKLTKEQIITLYLNRAYFGSGNYGVGNAAKFYFGKNLSKINLNEAAMLAGLLKAPSKYSPRNNRDLAERRTSIVLSNMVNAGYLNDDNLSEVVQDVGYKQSNSQRLYFADFAREQFPYFISKRASKSKSLSITTTLDEKVQERLESALNSFMKKKRKKLGKSEIAVVVMSKDGAVRGMSGGNSYQKSQFNRAVYSKRQVGSAFKTFVYLAAFESGFMVDDVFDDKKINVGEWLPENYNKKYHGDVTLKYAFAKSLNSVAVQLAKQLERGSVVSLAHRLGITSKIDKNDLTIALGTTEVSLYEMTASYATIANNGEAVIPYIITNIKGNKGRVLYKRESSGIGRVVSENAIEQIKEVLHEAVVNGTGKRANIASNIYGKTGTTQDSRDAWFVGFNDSYVIGVWIGNDDNSPTNKVTGGSLPASLFAEIMKKI